MENMLPTQEKSSSGYETNYMKQKNELIKNVKDNLNYIYIVLMIIVNCLLSLLSIEDGKVGLNYPKNGLGWTLWCLHIAFSTAIGVMILNAFRRQGIKNGHGIIKDVYNKYIEEITNSLGMTNPRSLKEYMKKQTIKDGFTKGTSLVLLNVLVMSLAISANLNSLLSLVTNILFSIGFGIKTMLEAEEYVVTELVIWYKLKTAEVTAQKLEPAEGEKNGNKLQRNERGKRSTRTGRVQPKQKRRARPKA